MERKLTDRTKTGLLAGTLALFGAGLLCFSGEVQASVRDSILYCLTALAPSLFPFLALTGLVVGSGAGEVLARPFGGLCRRIFKLPACCAAPLLMSFIGGYPAGSKGVSLLLERGKISREEAGRMMLFCVNPGPAFVVTFVGGTVLGDLRLGWLLCLTGTLAGLLLGTLTGLSKPVPEREVPQFRSAPAGAAVRSVADASRATLTLCAWVTLFAGETAILRGTGTLQFLCRLLAGTRLFTPAEAAAVLAFLLEVTGGTGAASALQTGAAFYAFGLAFGGLCVHLQIFSFFPEFPVRRWKFFLFRLLHGGLSAAIFSAAARFFPAAREASASIGPVSGAPGLSGTWAGGLSLLLMCGAFLLLVGKGKEEGDCGN